MSKFCMSCGSEMPDHAGFCPKCGSKVEIPHCPVCGREVDFGVDFCMYCGAKLTEEPPVSVMADAPQSQGEPFSTWEERKRTVEPKSVSEPTPSMEGMKEESPKTIAADAFPQEEEGGLEEDKRYALTARNPNLLTLRRIKNDVILQKDTVIIGDHQEDGSIPRNGKEIPYADIRCVELKWYMSTYFFICCLLLTIIVAVGLIISSIELQEALICILVPALFWWMCSRYNIIILKKDGSQEYIAGQKKAVMETLRKDLQDRVNLKAVSSYTGDLSEFIVKKTGYYQEQFANAKWGEKVKFNWAAFFFTGMFCYYRKSGKIFWRIYRSYLLLSVAAIAGMSAALTSLFKPETNISACLWVILTLALLQGIYGIICNIRLGKRFNAEYYKRCILLAESGDANEKKKGTSMGKAILFVIVLALCMALIGGIIGAVASNAFLNGSGPSFSDVADDWLDPAPSPDKIPQIVNDSQAGKDSYYQKYIVDTTSSLSAETKATLCRYMDAWKQQYGSMLAFAVYDLPDFDSLSDAGDKCFEDLDLTVFDAVLSFTADGEHFCIVPGKQFPVSFDEMPYSVVDVVRLLGDNRTDLDDFVLSSMHYMNILYTQKFTIEPEIDATVALYLRYGDYYTVRFISTETEAGARDLRQQLHNNGDREELFLQMSEEYNGLRDQQTTLYAGQTPSQVENAARNLYIGEISDPIPYKDEYLIFRREATDWENLIPALWDHLNAGSEPSWISELIGSYNYDSSFMNPDGTRTNFNYDLYISSEDGGVSISCIWRGMDIYSYAWGSEEDFDGTTLIFYEDDGTIHTLTYVPGDNSQTGSSAGVDVIYIDGDTNKPYIRTSYDG